MAKQMVSDLKPGEPVDAIFLVSEVVMRTARTGNSYLNLTLQDRSGQIAARLWDATEALASSINVDDFVRAKGKAESYQGQLQINIKSITQAETEGLHLGDFLPQSERDPAEMMKELRAILATIEDVDLRAVIEAFLKDERFCAIFRTAPAASVNHHAYLGGLLEHTLSMAQLAIRIGEHYSDLRRDLLLAGVFLHDVGKTRELSFRRSFKYTKAGNLCGHVVLGVLMLDERTREMNLPEEKMNMLRHMIVSHHGELEFGAAKLPMFAEAQALHYLDNLDAKMKDFSVLIADDRSGDVEFTDYSRRLARKLYKG